MVRLPAASGELDLGFRVTAREREAIRNGMQIYAAAPRVVKLSWDDWRAIAVACAVGSERIKATTGGETRTPAYTRPMSAFLKATGFSALNKDDLAAAVRMLREWDEIDAWRATRSPQLNNPREVEKAYHQREA